MTSYADVAALMKQQRIPLIVAWEAAEKCQNSGSS